jgi:hypothetical protein
VRRRLSPPHIVVIERRQIIMNQRIGVNQLDRAGTASADLLGHQTTHPQQG